MFYTTRLLRTLPKDSAGVSDVKENSRKEAKLDDSKWPSYDSIIQLKPSFSRISSPVKLILIYKMFKLQYCLLILTFSRVYKNRKSNIKIMGEGQMPCLPPPSGDGTETCSRNLARKGRNFSIG